MSLRDLGYTTELEAYRKTHHLEDFMVGRVSAEHKERYLVLTDEQSYDAEIIGHLRFTANSRFDFPAVGDWVAFSEYDEQKALIHAVFPRNSILERQAIGKFGEKQIIATNIDFAFIVQGVDRDFNINRIERYLTICYSSNVVPIIILSKIDLIQDQALQDLLAQIKSRVQNVLVFAISNETGEGLSELRNHIVKHKTYCLLGSSGVGKSSLINSISGVSIMKTGAIGEGTQRGKHVTSFRKLIVLENGGIIIDNPGMREVGITEMSSGLEQTFDSFLELAAQCKYKDCTHVHEKGCAIIAAVENGELDEDSYANFLKMEREQQRFNTTIVEKRKKDKQLGKLYKSIQRGKKKLDEL